MIQSLLSCSSSRPFMVVCVGGESLPRSSSNYRAVTKAVEAVVKEERHGSLSQKVKQFLKQCGGWSSKIEEKFPVVAEVKSLDEIDWMRTKLIQGVKEALGLNQTKAVVVSGYNQY